MMNIHKFLCFFLGSLLVAFVSCSKDEPTTPGGGGGGGGSDTKEATISLTSQTIESGAKPNISTNMQFSCTDEWTIENPNSQIISVSPTSGKAGDATVAVKWLAANQDNEVREFSFTIQCKNSKTSKQVKVTQKPLFEVESTNYKIKGDSCQLTINYKCNYETKEDLEIEIYYTDEFKEFCTFEDFTPDKVVINVQENNSKNIREGVFVIQIGEDENLRSAYIYITQEPKNIGVSKDFSQDGKVKALQTHTEGQGVPIVVMGDGYIDTEIADGTYEKTLRDACDKLFSIEPMTSLRPYFDIHMVTAVSKNNVFADDYSTALECEFEGGVSTLVTGNKTTCEKYALKAITQREMENALILVILNDTRDAGTCDMDLTKAKNGAPTGLSVAYVPQGQYYVNTLHHEVVGHGLGKLDDEYGANSIFYESQGSILDSKNAQALAQLKQYQSECALLNVTLESSIEKAPWYEFAKDSRYSSEKIGMYEGGDTFPYGVYRSTENSLMLDGDELNAISRCLLYKRIMNIANDFTWTYDYETFVKFDEPARKVTRNVTAPANDRWRKPRSRPIIRFK